MTGQPSFDPIPGSLSAFSAIWASRVASAINLIMGKINNGAALTLTHGATSTQMVDARLSAFSILTFMPMTANAAAIQSSIWVDGQGKGHATVHHASTANTDQDFSIGIAG